MAMAAGPMPIRPGFRALTAAALLLTSASGCQPWYRAYGIGNEAELHDPAAVPKLVAALQDGEHRAAPVLGEMGPPAAGAEDALLALLPERSVGDQPNLDALKRISGRNLRLLEAVERVHPGSEKLLQALVDQMSLCEVNRHLRPEAFEYADGLIARAVAYGDRAVPAFIRMLGGQCWETRLVGVRALGQSTIEPSRSAAVIEALAMVISDANEYSEIVEPARKLFFALKANALANGYPGAGARIVPSVAGDRAGPARTGRAAARSAGPVVAVFAIEDATGRLDPGAVSQLTEYLSVQLTETAGFRTVPRQRISQMLRDQKSESYRSCFDQACQIELGKALAAEKSLAGKVLRLGQQCTLTAKLFDLRTETVERASSVDVGCSLEQLQAGARTLARRLAR